jgi:hypothetical protein
MPNPAPIDAAIKLDFLIRHPVPRGVLGHEATMKSFAEKVGVARKTLIDQRQAGHLSPYVQDRLAERLKFALDWPEWLTGTCDAFRDRYTKEHQDEAYDETARTRVYDRAAKLKVERMTWTGDVQDGRPMLASLELFMQQAGPGEPIPVSVELICQPEPVGAFEIAVHRGRLELHPGAASIAPTPAPLGTDAPHTQPAHERTLTLRRGQAQDGREAWMVSSDKGEIGILRLDDDAALCRIADPTDGDAIIATFNAWVKDLDLAEPDPDDDTADTRAAFSFLRADGKPLSPKARQLIKRAILKDEFGEPEENGWHTLAASQRKLVRDDQ